MPYDATDFKVEPDLEALCKRDEVLRVLVEADRLLSGPERWCKDDFKDDLFGSYCVLGALGWREEREPNKYAIDAGFELAQLIHPDSDPDDIPGWNDAPERTFADVKALFARAISERARLARGA